MRGGARDEGLGTEGLRTWDQGLKDEGLKELSAFGFPAGAACSGGRELERGNQGRGEGGNPRRRASSLPQERCLPVRRRVRTLVATKEPLSRQAILDDRAGLYSTTTNYSRPVLDSRVVRC